MLVSIAAEDCWLKSVLTTVPTAWLYLWHHKWWGKSHMWFFSILYFGKRLSLWSLMLRQPYPIIRRIFSYGSPNRDCKWFGFVGFVLETLLAQPAKETDPFKNRKNGAGYDGACLYQHLGSRGRKIAGIQGEPGLHSEFRDSLNYIARPCPQNKAKQNKSNRKNQTILRMSFC